MNTEGDMVAYIPGYREGSASGWDQRGWLGEAQGSVGECKLWRRGGVPRRQAVKGKKEMSKNEESYREQEKDTLGPAVLMPPMKEQNTD